MIDVDTDVSVYVGGLVFAGGEGSEGFFLEPGGFTGWEDGVGAGVDTSARLGPGSFDVAPRLSDRLLTLRGKCWARSPKQLRDFGVRLAGLGADGARFQVMVEMYGESLWAWARRAPNAPKFDSSPALGYADYQVSFWLPNPRRFGETRLQSPPANTPVRLVNRGTMPASPRFQVWGPHPTGYSIVATGRPTFQVNGPLEAGVNDIVDFASGTVKRGGVPLVGSVPFPRTWAVPASGDQEWRFVPTGNGPITAEVTDTYV